MLENLAEAKCNSLTGISMVYALLSHIFYTDTLNDSSDGQSSFRAGGEGRRENCFLRYCKIDFGYTQLYCHRNEKDTIASFHVWDW